ncbi:MAG: tetratricopeptide repeat protein [Candidatus Odinarchaeota archaeon]
MKDNSDDSIPGKLKRAEDLLIQQDAEEARKLFEEVLEEEPDNWQALNGLGLIFANIDTYKSIEYFKLATQSCTDSDAPFFNLGTTYASLGQKKKAVEIWETGLIVESARLLQALGQEYLYGLGNYSKAREYLGRALELNPGREDIIYLLGTTYEQEGELVKAEECYLKAQNNYNAVVQLALLYWKIKRVEECVTLFEKALTIEDTHVVRFSLAAVYNDERVYNREKALENLLTGLEMYPYSGSAKNLLKRIIGTMSDEQRAEYEDDLARFEILGNSPENSISVDSVKEEYEIIKNDSCSECDGYLEIDKQSLVERNGHNFDRLETHCRNCKREKTYWFLIDSFF